MYLRHVLVAVFSIRRGGDGSSDEFSVSAEKILTESSFALGDAA